jgi:hypothetical protein
MRASTALFAVAMVALCLLARVQAAENEEETLVVPTKGASEVTGKGPRGATRATARAHAVEEYDEETLDIPARDAKVDDAVAVNVRSTGEEEEDFGVPVDGPLGNENIPPVMESNRTSTTPSS